MLFTANTGVKKKKKRSYREFGMLLILVVLCIIFAVLNHRFVSAENLLDMFRNTAILGILSVGMMVVILTGGIDLSVGAVVALTGMISAMLVRDHPGIPVVVALLVAMLVGAVCGMINGLLVAKGRIIPIIATLGMMNAYRGLTFIISDSAWVSAHEMPTGYKALATGGIGPMSNLVIICVVVMAVFYYFLTYTKSGRSIYAIGSNAEVVHITGIRKDRILILAYTILGLLAGLAGMLWVSKFASAQPDTATGYEMNVIAACVLGGVSIAGGSGKMQGLILGVLLLGIMENALPLVHVSPFWQSFIRGMIILIAIIVNVLIKRRSTAQILKRREI
ncbi:MAG: ABC transporter permease [Clostridiales Family XIII bacterium]|jgi:rhamnose transport system permease protein|nr:ABC transporter permease [Clostridiales Family XIII bacterium]